MRSRDLAVVWLPILALVAVGCSAVSESYEVNTADLECDAANRHVYDTLVDMGMEITGLKNAKPGSPGYVRGKKSDSRGTTRGEVEIRCDADGVHIAPKEKGNLLSEHEFERGVLLGVIGRGDLEVEREGRYATGVIKKRTPSPMETAASSTRSSDSESSTNRSGSESLQSGSTTAAGSIDLRVEPLVGFASILDFDADLSSAGILPVKVTVRNESDRAYEFDPQDLVLRSSTTKDKSAPLSASEAVDRLMTANRASLGAGGAQPTDAEGPIAPGAASELGDVGSAANKIRAEQLHATKIRAGQGVSGFLYYPLGKYDKARVIMTDAATGEAEGFVVEF